MILIGQLAMNFSRPLSPFFAVTYSYSAASNYYFFPSNNVGILFTAILLTNSKRLEGTQPKSPTKVMFCTTRLNVYAFVTIVRVQIFSPVHVTEGGAHARTCVYSRVRSRYYNYALSMSTLWLKFNMLVFCLSVESVWSLQDPNRIYFVFLHRIDSSTPHGLMEISGHDHSRGYERASGEKMARTDWSPLGTRLVLQPSAWQEWKWASSLTELVYSVVG